MAIQTDISSRSDARRLVDIFFIGLGLVLGGIIAAAGVWLWLDYQADPAHSALVFMISRLVTGLPDPLKSFFSNQAQVMDLPLTGQSSAYWYMARSGGVVAYLLLWLSTLWGLTLSTGLLRVWVPSPIAYGLHEFLSITTVIFIVLHALILLGDDYLTFNIVHLTIPFIAPYEPLGTGLGVIACYLAVVMTASFYIRRQIGQKTWRLLHYLTFLVYLLALLHGLMAGTDSSLLAVKLMYLVTGSSVLFLVYYRVLVKS